MRRRRGPISSAFSPRRSAVAAAAALLLAVSAAGCGTVSVAPADGSGRAVSTSAAAPAGQRILVEFGDKVVPATLTDTTAGREFAALLPLTLDLRDPMGQAKSGRLPATIDSTGADPVLDPEAGGIYYALDSATLAVFYDDLGQTVPAPGLIHLGAVDGDPTPIAAAGNRVRVRIDLADPTSP